ncbi:MAG: lactate racemase domain-containing protein, partial [Anaerolineales bacterium]
MKHTAPMIFPDTAVVKQNLYDSPIQDISAAVLSSLSALPVFASATTGSTVAVAVGSRGISHIDQVLYHCLEFLKEKGLKPFIVPAMGSHGGATPEGQQAVLAKLGITPSSMGVPIHSEMDVVQVGQLHNGVEIYFSSRALGADYIIPINRVKPHTKFRADIESGLCKMLTIGLGKAKGATEFHQRAVDHSFAIIEQAAHVILQQLNILFGVALLEDGYGNISRVEAILPLSIVGREKQLLQESSSMMGRIPFDHIDILIIDFIGKDISGIGMDSNVTGRHRDIVGDFSVSPHVKRIFVRDLSPASDGNGNGIGLADATTKRLVDAIDFKKTYVNALTAISPEKAAIPIYFTT